MLSGWEKGVVQSEIGLVSEPRIMILLEMLNNINVWLISANKMTLSFTTCTCKHSFAFVEAIRRTLLVLQVVGIWTNISAIYNLYVHDANANLLLYQNVINQ